MPYFRNETNRFGGSIEQYEGETIESITEELAHSGKFRGWAEAIFNGLDDKDKAIVTVDKIESELKDEFADDLIPVDDNFAREITQNAVKSFLDGQCSRNMRLDEKKSKEASLKATLEHFAKMEKKTNPTPTPDPRRLAEKEPDIASQLARQVFPKRKK